MLKKTLTYSYDLGGNLVTVREYAFTTAETLPASPVRTETGTYDTVWKDKLLNWNGTAMTYDAIGNMLTKGSTTFGWTQGRKLATVNNGKNIQYFYDHTGARTRKVVDGLITEYHMAGDLLLSEKVGTQTFWYRYDSAANLLSISTNGKMYFYVYCSLPSFSLAENDGPVKFNIQRNQPLAVGDFKWADFVTVYRKPVNCYFLCTQCPE